MKMRDPQALAIALLDQADVVAVAQCMALDVEAFPYPSVPLGFQPGVRTWVARGDRSRRVVGFLSERVRLQASYVQGFAVAAAVRRRGIGRALVQACVSQARAEGLHRVALHVSIANRAAIGLYGSEGFEVRRRLVGFYAPGVYQGVRDAFEMELRF